MRLPSVSDTTYTRGTTVPWRILNSLPKMMTITTTMMIATRAPVLRLNDEVDVPAAPASVFTLLLPSSFEDCGNGAATTELAKARQKSRADISVQMWNIRPIQQVCFTARFRPQKE